MDDLIQEYQDLLKRFGVKRELPKNTSEIRAAVYDAMIQSASDAGDEMWAAHLRSVRSGLVGRDTLADPGNVLVQEYAKSVELAVCRRYGTEAKLPKVYVADFPLGSFNAQALKVANGYLVLVNSGLSVLTLALLRTLNSDPSNDPFDVIHNHQAVDAIRRIAIAYLQWKDPIYGPLPLGGGLKGMRASFLNAAALQFVIAHEYGHILSGHLDRSDIKMGQVTTPVGALDIANTAWEDEFEADLVGYQILLGADAPSDLDLSILDRIEEQLARGADGRPPPEEERVSVSEAFRWKATLVAPLVLLAVDELLSRTARALQGKNADSVFHAPEEKLKSYLDAGLISGDHPPSMQRFERIMDLLKPLPSRHLNFSLLPIALLHISNTVVEQIAEIKTPPR